ncbi:Thioredoxin family protein [Tritrichomonas foetus]|uniref:Thioredoxin family protein n=1 Tax=Tritrichomonas foetus TaxID=1144522 RepID=A0A1J4JTZ6_9EUKA|nr:Thioredoxin family protein [Tritrichomonas foetus]|eukprot:OHT00980.1 Thioredoxin family protein [Tritrichomonas foetus]
MIFSLFFVFLSAQGHPYSVEITKDNLDDIIGKSKHVFIHFYSEGCRHCIKMAPEWNEVVRIYHPVTEIVMATINCDRWSSICYNLEGTSTPSIQHFAPGKKKGVQYKGAKTFEPIQKFVAEKTSIQPLIPQNCLIFVTPEELNQALSEGPALVIVDNHKSMNYDHPQIRACENQTDIPILALSQPFYPKESENICQGADHCILYVDDGKKVPFTKTVETNALLDFIDSNKGNDEL